MVLKILKEKEAIFLVERVLNVKGCLMIIASSFCKNSTLLFTPKQSRNHSYVDLRESGQECAGVCAGCAGLLMSVFDRSLWRSCNGACDGSCSSYCECAVASPES